MKRSPYEIAYRRRIRFAGALAVFLHGVVFMLLVISLEAFRDKSIGLTPTPDPIVVTLQPRDVTPPKRLADTVAPTEESVAPTDLIAESNSKAQDMSDAEGDSRTPDMPEVGEFDSVGGPPSQPVLPAPLAPPVHEEQPKAQESPEPVQSELSLQHESGQAPVEEADRGAKAEKEDETVEQPTEKPSEPVPELPEPFDVARAEIPPAPGADEGPSKARKPGGVEAKGFANFEANQSEMAPYLKQIREKVEREWRAALQMRYTGTTKTKAVVECEINPDGDLVSVEIVEPGNSVSYGPLCKDAITKAAPFGKFPFEVPDIYNNENLEIRWTFSFM